MFYTSRGDVLAAQLEVEGSATLTESDEDGKGESDENYN
jgi:hypothetical protein